MTKDSAQPCIALTVELLEPPLYSGRRRYQLFPEYVECLRAAGADALLIPADAPVEEALRLLARCDGLLLTGGDDPDLRALGGPAPLPVCKPVPRVQQDQVLALAREALRRDLPLLGVCLGHQMLGLAHGAPFVQDLPNAQAHGGGVRHRVQLEARSRLAQLSGGTNIEVASFHHQALAAPGVGAVAAAWSEDGVLEALEVPGRKFALGVQWHPERDPASAASRGLFAGFCAASRDYGATRK